MLEQLEREAHLWLARLDSRGAWTVETLSDAERRRADSFGHPRPRRHFIAGRALLRSALSHYAAVAPRDWIFRETDLGRPEIDTPSTLPIRFNLSHTDGFAVCLITERIDCGVDVEALARTVDIRRVAEHSFTPREVATLRDRSPLEQKQLFFSLWTLKEAYLKARGTGVRLRLDAVEFAISRDGVIRPRFSSDTRDQPTDWQFSLFAPDGDHLVATAVRGGTRPLEIRCRLLDAEGGSPRELPLPSIAAGGGR